MTLSLFMTSRHLPAPSPKRKIRNEAGNSLKDFSFIISALVFLIIFPSESKTAEYTSILLASVSGQKRSSGMKLYFSFTDSLNPWNIERLVSMPIRGIEAAYAIPLATETPILSPVYDPGPLLTATASSVPASRSAAASNSSIKTVSREACDRPSSLSLRAITLLSRQSATEHMSVAVSIHRIISFKNFRNCYLPGVVIYRELLSAGGCCLPGVVICREPLFTRTCYLLKRSSLFTISTRVLSDSFLLIALKGAEMILALSSIPERISIYELS